MYAKIKDSQIVKYPYTMKDLKNDFPHISFDSRILKMGKDLSFYGLVKVEPVQRPTPSELQKVKENLPELTIDKDSITAKQSFSVIDLEGEELTRKQAEKQKQSVLDWAESIIDSLENTNPASLTPEQIKDGLIAVIKVLR